MFDELGKKVSESVNHNLAAIICFEERMEESIVKMKDEMQEQVKKIEESVGQGAGDIQQSGNFGKQDRSCKQRDGRRCT